MPAPPRDESWEPSEEDIEEVAQVLRNLNDGAKWLLPAAGTIAIDKLRKVVTVEARVQGGDWNLWALGRVLGRLGYRMVGEEEAKVLLPPDYN